MDFIEKILDIPIYTTTWEKDDKLPFYILDTYKFQKVKLGDSFCIFMYPKNELAAIPALKKHILTIQETDQLNVVLRLEFIDAERRNALIKARIPFVVDRNQIYLPFLGVMLKEKYLSPKKQVVKLMPSSQLLLFYYLYDYHIELYTKKTAEILGFSAMQISRAARQLETLGLVEVRKKGTSMYIYREGTSRALYEEAKSYLLNPVRKKIYVEKNSLLKEFPLAGLSGLADLTMLNYPAVITYAFFGKTVFFTGSDALIDSDSQAEIEIWRYSPALLSGDPKVADILSIITSLLSNDDPRIEQAIDAMLPAHWDEERIYQSW